MGSWKNEDDIKAELRVLTDELRHLREELKGMVAPPKPNPTRAFLHRQSWPVPRDARDEPPHDPPPSADEKPRPPPRRKRRR
jgi:hypothetical protein